jgi:hypothetical protein
MSLDGGLQMGLDVRVAVLRALGSGAKRESGEGLAMPRLRSCPRNCKRRAAVDRVTDGDPVGKARQPLRPASQETCRVR